MAGPNGHPQRNGLTNAYLGVGGPKIIRGQRNTGVRHAGQPMDEKRRNEIIQRYMSRTKGQRYDRSTDE